MTDRPAFFRIGNRCYPLWEQQPEGRRVKRVNLVEYFNLADALAAAKRATGATSTKGGNIWVGAYVLPSRLRAFVADDNGFSACKHVATELADGIEGWFNENLMDGGSPPQLSTELFDAEFHSWQYGSINTKIDAFRSVFEAECRDVDVYSVGQISIYKTSALVSDGAGVIPHEIHAEIPSIALEEFNSAGKCLAFDLPTACGFHALRGLELVMGAYLESFGVNVSKLKSWNDYIKAAEKLSQDTKAPSKPSPKVTAMLDRLRELERNPLMHPRDTLDSVQADMLFRLCAITVVEMTRDLRANKDLKRDAANNIGRNALQRDANKTPEYPPQTPLGKVFADAGEEVEAGDKGEAA